MQELIARLKRGDQEALGACIESCYVELLKVAKANLSPSLRARVDESDIVQDVCLAITPEKLRTFEGNTKEDLVAWLTGFVVNKARDRKQIAGKRDPKRETPIDGADGRACPYAGIQSSSTSPSGKAIRHERGVFTLEAIEGLERPQDRDIMRLRYYEGLTFERIAEKIGMSKSYVVSRHAACVELLRPHFAQAEGRSDVDS